ncbi:PREDICTED: chondroadherin-like protein [Myotis brandtii]|uniref:chondroadherin-like protein n=1 Tax=Myotis brandtii TaxID=109478 RepID=UPI0003BB80F3|nr:PREDICTED: chondroadherin-like protein [Myotis brandtii]
MEGPQSISSVLLLFLLLPLGPTGHTAAQRCPQTCVCDNSRRHVACRHQNLTEVPNAIPELTQRLDLQGNLLKVLGPAAFQDLPYLTHLDLRHCQVELVAEGAFRGLGRLLFLNLASNRLRLGPRLQSLHLQKNQLQALPALPGLSQLELVDLSGNPFRCDCQLLPLHRWLTGLNLRVGATCAAPPSARGQRVKAAVAVFEACPSWASRKAKQMPSARRTRVKGRQRGADKVGRGGQASSAYAPLLLGHQLDSTLRRSVSPWALCSPS